MHGVAFGFVLAAGSLHGSHALVLASCSDDVRVSMISCWLLVPVKLGMGLSIEG
jgi:hypothetical protein